MRKAKHSILTGLLALAGLAPATLVVGQESAHESDAHHSGADAERHSMSSDESNSERYEQNSPLLPVGMTLDEVLERASTPPPDDFGEPVPDTKPFAFLLGEQLEVRVDPADQTDHLGWELQGWFGQDFYKLWLKTEGEAALAGESEVETETDLLFSTLITPFFSAQIGAQYAFGWAADPGYDDLWSGAFSIQGLAPGKFEIDASFYFSEDLDLTAAFEAELDLRLTQRLVFQPLLGLGFSAQEIPERELGAGLTDLHLDGRLRYEIRRDFAPYLGVRYRLLVGPTADFAGDAAGVVYLLAGLRFAL